MDLLWGLDCCRNPDDGAVQEQRCVSYGATVLRSELVPGETVAIQRGRLLADAAAAVILARADAHRGKVSDELTLARDQHLHRVHSLEHR